MGSVLLGLFVLCDVGLFGWLLIYLRAPDTVVYAMTGLASEPWQVLLILNVILLVLGCFMEGIAIMLLTVPMFLLLTTGALWAAWQVVGG